MGLTKLRMEFKKVESAEKHEIAHASVKELTVKGKYLARTISEARAQSRRISGMFMMESESEVNCELITIKHI